MGNGASGNGNGSGNGASVNGNGHHRMWYYGNEHPSRPERNQRRVDRDHKTISPKTSRLSNLSNSPHSSSPSKLAGSPSRRAWTSPSPSNSTSRVYKNPRPRVYGRIPPRRKSTGGLGVQRPLLRTATGFTYPRGLEVVFEEGGSTPER
jgi:hypothetical protein